MKGFICYFNDVLCFYLQNVDICTDVWSYNKTTLSQDVCLASPCIRSSNTTIQKQRLGIYLISQLFNHKTGVTISLP